MPGQPESSDIEHHRDDLLDQEAHDTQPQGAVEDEGSVLSGVGLLGDVPDDPGHEYDQAADTKGHGDFFEFYDAHESCFFLVGISKGRAA